MLSAIIALCIVAGCIVAIPVIRGIRKARTARVKMNRASVTTTASDMVSISDEQPITRPIALYTVRDALGRVLTAEPLSYRDAHGVARMYAKQWVSTFPHQLPIQVFDFNGESVVSYDLQDAASIT